MVDLPLSPEPVCLLAFPLVCRRGRSGAYPAAGSCIPAAAGASPPRACGQWPGCASSARHPRDWNSCRCPSCLVVVAAGRRRMTGEVERVQWGSTRPSASSQGSRLQALLWRRDSVSVLESAWQAAMGLGGLECFRRGGPDSSAAVQRGAQRVQAQSRAPGRVQQLAREAGVRACRRCRRRCEAGVESVVGVVVQLALGKEPVREGALFVERSGRIKARRDGRGQAREGVATEPVDGCEGESCLRRWAPLRGLCKSGGRRRGDGRSEQCCAATSSLTAGVELSPKVNCSSTLTL